MSISATTLPGSLTQAQRQDMYRRIFEGIPPSFLNPDHPNNQAIMGAVAVACAFTEQLYVQFASGLFLNTAGNSTVGADGMTDLERWGAWLNVPQQPGESTDSYRLRLMSRLFSPRVTINAIQSAIAQLTGKTVTVQTTYNQVVEFNDPDWATKYLQGVRYNVMVIEVITDGGACSIPSTLMDYLRAAGVHWWHIERDAMMLLASWQVKGALTTSSSQGRSSFLQRSWQPNDLPGVLQPSNLYSGTVVSSQVMRAAYGMRCYLVEAASPTQMTVHAVNDNSSVYPTFTWDSDTALWGESVWPD